MTEDVLARIVDVLQWLKPPNIDWMDINLLWIFLFTKSNIFFVVVFFVDAYKDLTAENRPSNSYIFNIFFHSATKNNLSFLIWKVIKD